MKFHDFHLDGYEVSRKGEAIVLHLIWDYPGADKDESHIAFTGVTLYNFTHTVGATITDIEERPIMELVQEFGEQIAGWSRANGVELWQDTFENYITALQASGFGAWQIGSAIGFCGFVIAKTIGEA